jgi:hypothetical protein
LADCHRVVISASMTNQQVGPARFIKPRPLDRSRLYLAPYCQSFRANFSAKWFISLLGADHFRLHRHCVKERLHRHFAEAPAPLMGRDRIANLEPVSFLTSAFRTLDYME